MALAKKTLLKKSIKYLLKSMIHPCHFIRNLLWKLNCHVSGKINVYAHCAIDLHKGAKIKINNGILNIGVKKNRKYQGRDTVIHGYQCKIEYQRFS